MNTTEKIVEAYCRHIKKWLTLPNLRDRNTEIDLLAQDLREGLCYHIEVRVSVLSGFSKLKADSYKLDEEKVRGKGAAARNKIGFYVAKKFGNPAVLELYKDQGIDLTKLRKVIVAWDATESAVEEARFQGIEVWLMPDIIKDMLEELKGSTGYQDDDTLWTLHLVARALARKRPKKTAPQVSPIAKPSRIPTAAWGALAKYLQASESPVAMSFSKVESVISYTLPLSARKHRPWWANTKANTHSNGWLNSGWKVESVELAKEQVTFVRN